MAPFHDHWHMNSAIEVTGSATSWQELTAANVVQLWLVIIHNLDWFLKKLESIEYLLVEHDWRTLLVFSY
jgi:hypothetical protein